MHKRRVDNLECCMVYKYPNGFDIKKCKDIEHDDDHDILLSLCCMEWFAHYKMCLGTMIWKKFEECPTNIWM